MGRPSKLTESQWSILGERLLKGEGVNALAREYGISKAAISGRFGNTRNKLKGLAERIAADETEFSRLPITEQRSVRNLADELKAISYHLANAAKSGAFVAARLNEAAATQAAQIDTVNMTGDDLSRVAKIAGLTKTANEASVIARDLIKTNRENSDAPPPIDKTELLREIVDNLPD